MRKKWQWLMIYNIWVSCVWYLEEFSVASLQKIRLTKIIRSSICWKLPLFIYIFLNIFLFFFYKYWFFAHFQNQTKSWRNFWNISCWNVCKNSRMNVCKKFQLQGFSRNAKKYLKNFWSFEKKIRKNSWNNTLKKFQKNSWMNS